MSTGTRKKATVKLQMAIDSGASANVIDEGRFRKIQERSKERLRLEKSKVKLYGYASDMPIPVAGKFNAMVEYRPREGQSSRLYVETSNMYTREYD